MWRSKVVIFIYILLLNFSFGLIAQAAEPNANTQTVAQPKKSVATNDAKKKIKLNFEDELVTGNYEAPDALFMSSRRLIKYKELFNRRTNFIDEIESNKGLFNEHQK